MAAGLPLERALSALSDEAETPRQRDLVSALRTEVNAGAPFAKALAQHPREFSHIYVAVIGAGTMGSGIAMNFLNAGLPVTLLLSVGQGLAVTVFYVAVAPLVPALHSVWFIIHIVAAAGVEPEELRPSPREQNHDRQVHHADQREQGGRPVAAPRRDHHRHSAGNTPGELPDLHHTIRVRQVVELVLQYAPRPEARLHRVRSLDVL